MQIGHIYLLHFEEPISKGHTTQHYLGFSEELFPRLHAHYYGHGARLTQVARERCIKWKVARLWVGNKKYEGIIKRRIKNSRLLYPICSQKPRNVVGLNQADDEILQKCRTYGY